MKLHPIKKLIIIYGLHLEKIEIHTDIGNTLKRLEEKRFFLSQSYAELNIEVYKCYDFLDLTLLTHLVIGFSNEITEIRYYKTKL